MHKQFHVGQQSLHIIIWHGLSNNKNILSANYCKLYKYGVIKDVIKYELPLEIIGVDYLPIFLKSISYFWIGQTCFQQVVIDSTISPCSSHI